MTLPHPKIDTEQPRQPIGVFDSGLGGLRVLDRLMQMLPDERFVYLGDTLHMPYGDKSQKQVNNYVEGCLSWLFGEHRVKMVVVACNTAAAVATPLFQRYIDIPFIDPVTPICRWLSTEASYQTVGVMATPTTVASNRYQLLINQHHQNQSAPLTLHAVACDHLASVIEAGKAETPECREMLIRFLNPLKAQNVEAIILGCTHYPYVMQEIAALSPGIDILDPSVFMAVDAKKLLSETQLATPETTGRMIAEVDYFVTAEPERFYQTSRGMPFQALAMKPPTIVSIPDPACSTG